MRRKTALFLLSTFFIIQISQSVLRKNYWPFLSYSMFTEKFDYKGEVVVTRIIYQSGEKKFVSPWTQMPLEIFKSLNLLKKMFLLPEPILKNKRDAISKLIIESYKDAEIIGIEFLALNMEEENFDSLKYATKIGRPLYQFILKEHPRE